MAFAPFLSDADEEDFLWRATTIPLPATLPKGPCVAPHNRQGSAAGRLAPSAHNPEDLTRHADRSPPFHGDHVAPKCLRMPDIASGDDPCGETGRTSDEI
jgi:hypothetical protein